MEKNMETTVLSDIAVELRPKVLVQLNVQRIGSK